MGEEIPTRKDAILLLQREMEAIYQEAVLAHPNISEIYHNLEVKVIPIVKQIKKMIHRGDPMREKLNAILLDIDEIREEKDMKPFDPEQIDQEGLALFRALKREVESLTI